MTELAIHPVTLMGGTLQHTPLALIGLATSVSVFAFFGYGSAIYFTEEMHDAPRLIGRTILWAVVITVLTELAAGAAVLVGAPDLKSLIASQSPFGDFVLARGGRLLNQAISLAVALAILNAGAGDAVAECALLLLDGRDLAWHRHINDAFTRTHPRFHSPWIATLAAVARRCSPAFWA